jgi:hypothetical protein
MVSAFAARVAKRLRSLPQIDTASLHRLRRELSRELAHEDGAQVIEIARSLHASGAPGSRTIAFGILGQHLGALRLLDARALESFGAGLRSWGDVDMFGCLLAGRAWRDGAIRDSTIQRWARSADRLWRRLSLVCTVPLNVKSQGGEGDAARTLAVCALLVQDREDLVVKALSWALRELAQRAPKPVAEFVETHDAELAARVKRDVKNKLETGLKRVPRPVR